MDVAHSCLCQLVIMHASTQERYKHSIPPQRAIDAFRPGFPSHLAPDVLEDENSTCRINITFRFYRVRASAIILYESLNQYPQPDFRPPSIPRCKCNVPCVLRADMKGREKGDIKGEWMRYFWMCYAGAQNDGKGCSFVKVMDAESEGRGPFIGDRKPSDSSRLAT
jgi:hypothetical protein